ncbi:hypothetical protein ACIBQ1_17035 [Nonomuraea sp. NPDC050153]|uniref:hypothetical protein n=1 Tax=Nonomuraea sp. NPDC050153 TaxID=3364359 RepID=UPI0037B008C3
MAMVDVYDRAYEAAAAELSLSAAQACVLGRLDERRGMGALAACSATMSMLSAVTSATLRLPQVPRLPL